MICHLQCGHKSLSIGILFGSNHLQNCAVCQLLKRFILSYRQPVHEPAELSVTDVYCLFSVLRPVKSAFLNAALQQPESIDIPEQALQFISVAIAEDKQTGAEWIQIKLFPDQDGQAVNSTA